MNMFRIFLFVLLCAIVLYTIPVVLNHGINLFPIFFGDITEMGWPGQFNFDFLAMLTLSAFWTAWRNKFSMKGLGLAILAFFFGAPFLCIYLLYLSFQTGGNPKAILLGDRLYSTQSDNLSG